MIMWERLGRHCLAFAVSVFLLAGAGWAGTFFEIGDAGRTLLTAQTTIGHGPLDSIFGNLSENPPDTGRSVDLFQIRILDPLAFSGGTVDFPGFSVSDPQLFLFDSVGTAVYMNDDDESGLNGSQSMLPPGHLLGPQSAGLYYLGIGWFDNEPESALGPMFDSSSATGTNGPGVGGGAPLLGWNDNVTQRIDLPTFYEVRLTGTGFAAVPEPGTTILLALPLAALLCRVARRRVLP
jgi:hypothetical protein